MNIRGHMFHEIDIRVTKWMAANGIKILRISLGLIFLWFGALKFFPGMSPAEDLAINTISKMTFGFIPDAFIINGLALWEVLIGIGLIFGFMLRETLLLLYLQMIGTFMPVFLFPSEVFNIFPVSLTIEGQYNIKSIFF